MIKFKGVEITRVNDSGRVFIYDGGTRMRFVNTMREAFSLCKEWAVPVLTDHDYLKSAQAEVKRAIRYTAQEAYFADVYGGDTAADMRRDGLWDYIQKHTAESGKYCRY